MKKLIFLLLFLLMGCTSTVPKEQTKLHQLQESANHVGLIEFYKQKIQADPNDFLAHNELAYSYLQINDIESANFYLQRAIEHQSATAKTHYLQGLVFDRKHQYSQALISFTLANSMGDNSRDVYFYTGLTQAKLSQFEHAIASLNQARIRGYEEEAIKNNLGLIYTQQGQYEAAINILLPLYEKDPLNEKVKSNLAIALIKSGDHQQANQLLNHMTPNKSDPLPVELPPLKVKPHHSDDVMSEDASDSTITITEVTTNDLELAPLEPELQPLYTIQLGSYRNEQDANQRLQQLSETSIEARIQQIELEETGTWYRLLSGEFRGFSSVIQYIDNHSQLFENVEYFIQPI